MKPFLISVKERPKDSEGGFGVGRPSFFTYIVLAQHEQDARDLVDELVRDGCKVDDCLGVASEVVAGKYDLKPNVPELFHEHP